MRGRGGDWEMRFGAFIAHSASLSLSPSRFFYEAKLGNSRIL
jgi:hypothetical protein